MTNPLASLVTQSAADARLFHRLSKAIAMTTVGMSDKDQRAMLALAAWASDAAFAFEDLVFDFRDTSQASATF